MHTHRHALPPELMGQPSQSLSRFSKASQPASQPRRKAHCIGAEGEWRVEPRSQPASQPVLSVKLDSFWRCRFLQKVSFSFSLRSALLWPVGGMAVFFLILIFLRHDSLLRIKRGGFRSSVGREKSHLHFHLCLTRPEMTPAGARGTSRER